MSNPERYQLPTYDWERDCNIEPHHDVAVFIEDNGGMRVILDEEPEAEDSGSEPDVLIERHKDRWLILIHRDEEPVAAIELYAQETKILDGNGAALAEVPACAE